MGTTNLDTLAVDNVRLNSSTVDLGNLQVITFDAAFGDFTDGGGAAGTYDLSDQIPAGAYVIAVGLQAVVGFAGDVSAVATFGDGTDADRYNTGTPSVFATAANGVSVGDPSGTRYHNAAATVTITVTSATDWGSVTAGQLTGKIWYIS